MPGERDHDGPWCVERIEYRQWESGNVDVVWTAFRTQGWWPHGETVNSPDDPCTCWLDDPDWVGNCNHAPGGQTMESAPMGAAQSREAARALAAELAAGWERIAA